MTYQLLLQHQRRQLQKDLDLKEPLVEQRTGTRVSSACGYEHS
jgi:hypothetical protein